MKERQRDQLIEGHDVDGIREYDNPMPRWWLWTFYATILFSVGYWIYYHLGGPGQSAAQEYSVVMEKWNAEKLAKSPPMEADEATLLAAFKNPAEVAAGKTHYDAKCVACHAQKGEGLVGPNLTDDHWIHGKGTLTGIFKVVRDGVPAKGMVPWGTQMKKEEIIQVVAFVASLSGTNPPNPKKAEGEKVDKPSWK